MGKNSLPEDFFPCRGKNSSLPRKILITSIKQTLQNRQGLIQHLPAKPQALCQIAAVLFSSLLCGYRPQDLEPLVIFSRDGSHTQLLFLG